MIKTGVVSGSCGIDCAEFLRNYGTFWLQKSKQPVALLQTTPDRDAYLSSLNTKARNMVRKAERLYVYREYDYNTQLDGMYLINTSKPVRQGRSMTEGYRDRPEPIRKAWRTCDLHKSAWYGGFDADDKLAVYCNLIQLDQLGIVNRILGHADAAAAMNGMFSYLVTNAPVSCLYYLTLRGSSDGLAAFKRSVGFREVKA